MAMKNKLLIKPKKTPQLQKIPMTYKQVKPKWSGTMDKHLHWFIFWKNNIDNVESPISNNIWVEIKLKVEQQGPTKINKQCKAYLRA